MKTETVQRDDHQVQLIAEVEQEMLERYKRSAARKISSSTRIAGFRPGKAPYDIVRRHYGDQAIHEEAITLSLSPGGQLIGAGFQLIAHLPNASDPAIAMRLNQPVPERWAEVEAVLQVLGLDEDVGIQQVSHQVGKPSVRPSSLNVPGLLMPSMRNASRYNVRPSSVLATSVCAKRRLTRDTVVR